MQRCYVHFMDTDMQRYWESRMNIGKGACIENPVA